MADRYWVGGSGTWDATTTTNWSDTSGGLGGASAPTSADNVIFNSLSNATGYTVTVGTNAVCADLTATGPLTGNVTFSLGATAVLSCYGSMTLPATNLTWTGTAGAILNFLATTTGKTVTTNGVSITATLINFNGGGGEWTLGSAFSTGSNIAVVSGSFVTNNFNLTSGQFNSNSGNTRSVSLGSSTITLSAAAPLTFVSTGLTFTAGTSQITCSSASPTFAGGGLTFNNVTFSSTALGASVITGSNTFNNLTYTARAAAGVGVAAFDGGGTNTINGTLTLGSGTIGTSRLFVRSSFVGVTTTLSVATLAAMTDIDFRDISVSGASSPWSGTRIGNCLGNSNITFTAARTVYWNSAASANWNNAVWSTTSGNTGGATTNLPLAQDTIVIDNSGLTTGNTITFVNAYSIGTLDFSSRSNAATFATGVGTPTFYGDYVLSSAITVSGTGLFTFAKQSGTATITSAAKTFTQPITINAPSGTVRINGDLTLGSTLTTTLTQGTLDLTNGGAGNHTLSTGLFNSNNSNNRAITFGTGNITLTGNATTIWTANTSTNLTYTGTPTVNATYSGSTGTRTIQAANTAGFAESNSFNFNISAGTDIINLGASRTLNLNFTGFTGAWTNTSLTTIFGNLTLTSSMNCAGTTSAVTFSKSSGIQTITTNGNTTIDFPITKNSDGTLQLQDNLTTGATRTFTLSRGTLDLSSGNRTLSTGLFISNNANTRSILFGTGNITVTGNNATVFSTANSTNFTYTGTPTINATYSGSTGTRTINANNANNGTEANALNFNISAGSDIIDGGFFAKNVNFTGFVGTFSNTTNRIFENLTLSSGMTLTAGNLTTTFAATSGTQQITTNGKTLDFPLTFNGLGGTFAFQDALTMGDTRTLTLNAGNLLLKSGTTNTVGNIVLSGNDPTNTKLGATDAGFQAFLQKVVGGIITASNITVQDSSVTPIETWYGDRTVVDGGNNTNWEFLVVSATSHDGFLPQEIRKFQELDKKAKEAEAYRVRAAKLVAYHRKRKFTELLAPELINPKEESFYEQLREQQFPEEVAREKAEQAKQEATAEAKAKVEAKKREIKKELKRLQKEEKDALAKIDDLNRQKQLLIDSVMARQKEMEIQAQLTIVYKLQQEEMEDEATLLLLI